jgi:hypothetical protein
MSTSDNYWKANDMKDNGLSRRSALKTMGVMGASSLFAAETIAGERKTSDYINTKDGLSDVRKAIHKKVFQTLFVDTHEHLPEERERLAGRGLFKEISGLCSFKQGIYVRRRPSSGRNGCGAFDFGKAGYNPGAGGTGRRRLAQSG